MTVFAEADLPVSRDEFLRSVRGVDGILSMLTERINAEVFEAAGPQLKVVASMAVGYDNVHVEDAKKYHVMVTNTPDVLTETTADLTFALLMASARRVTESERYLREGKWKSWAPMLLTGPDVYGATLGIVGMGRIGEAVVKRAVGFGMKVVYYNRSRRPEAETRYGCTYDSFENVLRQADFVVLLTPATPETHKMMGEREFRLMKKSAVLVNTSRGTVVDEQALYHALAERRIWGAGLDVFEQEPIAMNHPLLTLDNVVLLPHIGSASIQTRLKMADMAADNLLAAVQGREPQNRVL